MKDLNNHDTTHGMTENWLSQLEFHYPLRKYQQEIIDLCNQKLDNGEKELHIVAPPGAGKTIIGIQIISQFNCPSLVLCPNTTIQSQWGNKLRHFLPVDYVEQARKELIGTHEDRPLKPITLLTYQALSVPGKEKAYLSELAREAWIDELTSERKLTRGEAELRILELMQNNPKSHKKEMGRHMTRLRRKLTDVLDLEQVLHPNALELMQSLRRQGCKLVIFDECHHLTDYWAAVMINFVKSLDEFTIVGLTGTPPEAKTSRQTNRYLNLVGEIDYQVPTPALVKEGGLAPFQDLVYITEPSQREKDFLKEQHSDLHELLVELTEGSEAIAVIKQQADPVVNQSQASGGSSASTELMQVAEETSGYRPREADSRLSRWVGHRVREHTGLRWNDFVSNKPGLAMAMFRYLWKFRLLLPPELETSDSVRQAPLLDDWMKILEDFALGSLKISPDKEDQELYNRIKQAIRKIGFSLSERGIRRIASPVDRVLAFSQTKASAVATILDVEYRSLDDRLRAVVVTDFEKMSPTAARSVKGVLKEESGGALGVLSALLDDRVSEFVNPCLVTGSLLLIDRRIAEQVMDAAREYVKERTEELELLLDEDESDSYVGIYAKSDKWRPRLYVGMITSIFERGITKCLIGTRGILGEGWDSQQLNTIVDMTTTTSPVSVKQLRGRGIRLNTENPLAERKVSNNWDIVCIAPDLEKGLNDYHRFVRKHDGYFGISDDGQIECGVGHVHPAFSELTPAEVFASIDEFNSEMLQRALCRDQIYELWKVGQGYSNRHLGCIEVSQIPELSPAPPVVRGGRPFHEQAEEFRDALTLTHIKNTGGGILISLLMICVLAFVLHSTQLWFICLVPALGGIYLSRTRAAAIKSERQELLLLEADQNESLRSIAGAVLMALKTRAFIPDSVKDSSIVVSRRSDDSYRIFLDDVETEHSETFTRCLDEVLAPVTNQPYLVPRYEFAKDTVVDDTFIDRYLRGIASPEVGRYHAVPKILARSEKGRQAFEEAWNEHVSPGNVVSTENDPMLLQRYFGMGPSLAERMLWD